MTVLTVDDRRRLQHDLVEQARTDARIVAMYERHAAVDHLDVWRAATRYRVFLRAGRALAPSLAVDDLRAAFGAAGELLIRRRPVCASSADGGRSGR